MPLGIGIGVGIGPFGGRAVGFLPQTLAWVAANSTPPTQARTVLVNNLISSLIAGGVWAKLDTLYLFAAANSQSATLNLVTPGTYTATLVNAPTFTTDRGFQGNGTSSHVNTNWTASTHGVQYQVGSSHIMAWCRTAYSGAGNSSDIGAQASPGAEYSWMLFNATFKQGFANTGAGATFVTNTTTGMQLLASRTGAQTFYVNGASVTTATATPTAVPTTSMLVGAVNFMGGSAGSWSARQYAAASTGAELTAPQASAYYTALQTYMTAVGA